MNSRQPNLIRAQGQATQLTNKYGTQPGKLDFDDLAMILGVLVMEGGISGAAARLVRGKKGGRIRLNSKIQTDGARRFAIGHELGHWVLHKDESQLFLCTNEDFRDYAKSPMEVEANYFASELLMPTMLFRPLMQKAEPSFEAIKEWAALFRISLIAATLRYIRDSKHNCFAVYVQDAKIKWWWKKEDGPKIWLTNGQPISRDSVTWEVVTGAASPCGMEDVPAAAWFAHLPFDYNGTVMEDATAMPRYGGVFTLLWLT